MVQPGGSVETTRSSQPLTNTIWRWSSRAHATSGIRDGGDASLSRRRRWQGACAEWRLSLSPSVTELHVAPGALRCAISDLPDVSAEDVSGQLELAQRLEAELVVVGREAPLVAGLADHCASGDRYGRTRRCGR